MRAAVVCGAYLMSIIILGVCYWWTEPVQEEYEDLIGLNDLEVYREFTFALISLGLTFIISIIWLLLYRCCHHVALIFHLVILVAATVGIVYLSILFNSNFSLTWLAAFAICGFLEFVVA